MLNLRRVLLTRLNVTNLLCIFNFPSTKTTCLAQPEEAAVQESMSGNIKFWFSGDADTGIYWF